MEKIMYRGRVVIVEMKTGNKIIGRYEDNGDRVWIDA